MVISGDFDLIEIIFYKNYKILCYNTIGNSVSRMPPSSSALFPMLNLMESRVSWEKKISRWAAIQENLIIFDDD